MNGLWQFPGGAIEDGEQNHHAGWRELYEETGIVVSHLNKDLNRHWTRIGMGIGVTSDGYPHVTQFFLLETIKEPLFYNKEPEKHSDWEWVTPEELLKRPIIELMRPIIEGLK